MQKKKHYTKQVKQDEYMHNLNIQKCKQNEFANEWKSLKW